MRKISLNSPSVLFIFILYVLVGTTSCDPCKRCFSKYPERDKEIDSVNNTTTITQKDTTIKTPAIRSEVLFINEPCLDDSIYFESEDVKIELIIDEGRGRIDTEYKAKEWKVRYTEIVKELNRLKSIDRVNPLNAQYKNENDKLNSKVDKLKNKIKTRNKIILSMSGVLLLIGFFMYLKIKA